MSIKNPYSQNFGWKVDPDNRQDRSNGPCITRMMTDEEKIKYGLVERKENVQMEKITRDAVKRMAASGMTVAQIADHFLPHYPKMNTMLMDAKVKMLLSDKKPGGKRKSKENNQDNTVKDDNITTTLKMRSVEDTETGCVFELCDDALVIVGNVSNVQTIKIPWDRLEAFALKLQKIKQIHLSA